MNAPRKERLARNEALFRDVNERINDLADELGRDQAYSFVCECSDPGCAERIVLTSQEYEQVRASATRFVVAPGHVADELEHVVERAGDHVVVEKTGVAADVAQRLDPRAA